MAEACAACSEPLDAKIRFRSLRCRDHWMHRDCWEEAVRGLEHVTMCPICTPPPESAKRAYNTVATHTSCHVNIDFRGGYIVLGKYGAGVPLLPPDEVCARARMEPIDYVPLEIARGEEWWRVGCAVLVMLIAMFIVFSLIGLLLYASM